MVDDAQLLDAWRGGDRAAGEALFDRYFERIRRFFLARLEGDVDDLIQQTFEACVQGRDRVREDSSFRSYIFGVAYNVMRADRRLRWRHGRAVDAVETVRSLGPGPSTWMRAREDARWLQQGLRTLPLPLRMVLELYYFEQLSAGDIARILVCPEGTVRSRLRRGRRLLRVALLEREEGPRGDAEVSGNSYVSLGSQSEIEPA